MSDYERFQNSVIQRILETSKITGNDFNLFFENIKANYIDVINSFDESFLKTLYQHLHPADISNSIFAIRYGLNPTNFNNWFNMGQLYPEATISVKQYLRSGIWNNSIKVIKPHEYTINLTRFQRSILLCDGDNIQNSIIPLFKFGVHWGSNAIINIFYRKDAIPYFVDVMYKFYNPNNMTIFDSYGTLEGAADMDLTSIFARTISDPSYMYKDMSVISNDRFRDEIIEVGRHLIPNHKFNEYDPRSKQYKPFNNIYLGQLQVLDPELNDADDNYDNYSDWFLKFLQYRTEFFSAADQVAIKRILIGHQNVTVDENTTYSQLIEIQNRLGLVSLNEIIFNKNDPISTLTRAKINNILGPITTYRNLKNLALESRDKQTPAQREILGSIISGPYYESRKSSQLSTSDLIKAKGILEVPIPEGSTTLQIEQYINTISLNPLDQSDIRNILNSLRQALSPNKLQIVRFILYKYSDQFPEIADFDLRYHDVQLLLPHLSAVDQNSLQQILNQYSPLPIPPDYQAIVEIITTSDSIETIRDKIMGHSDKYLLYQQYQVLTCVKYFTSPELKELFQKVPFTGEIYLSPHIGILYKLMTFRKALSNNLFRNALN